MKRIHIIGGFLSLSLLLPSCGSVNLNDVLEAVEDYQGQALSQEKAGEGLKEALRIGIQNAASSASSSGGFINNPLIKIPFPPEVANVETKLRALGMGGTVDKFVNTLNAGAEEASKKAAPIFVDAIKEMSITDALTILKGDDDAATAYLKSKTSAKLEAAFLPVISQALQKVQVTKYWNPIVTTYNGLPMTDDINPNLEAYVTQEAMEGLFLLLSQEEAKIRNNPGARVTDLLKEVFAHQDGDGG